jgi:hypothetical protein
MSLFFRHTLFWILVFIAPAIFAWDSVGHRVISAIAYAHLTSEARQKIDEITAFSEPAYPALSRFLYLSMLPDIWRKKDRGTSSSWHFINTPWTTDNTPSPPATVPNLVTVLKHSQSILQNPQSPTAEKYTALAYVIHLIEDAHQPLHCISRFSTLLPQGDKGGNLFPIRTAHAKNLHAYWDQSARHMLPHAKKYPLNNKQIVKLASRIQAAHPENMPEIIKRRGIKEGENWAAESYTLAHEKVYSITMYTAPSPAYKVMQQEIASMQMAIAGYRLADVLNRLFAS